VASRRRKARTLLTRIGTVNVFVVYAEEKLTAFVELERAIYGFAVDLIS
jgi:hypothetical protein